MKNVAVLNTDNKIVYCTEWPDDKHKTIEAFGLKTRIWEENATHYYCAECCNGDRCGEDCTAKYKGDRKNCPHCRGAGRISKLDCDSKPIDPIEQAIANGIEFKDQQQIKQLIWNYTIAPEFSCDHEEAKMEPFKPYAIPEGMKVVFRQVTDWSPKLAFIEHQPKEETQDELWQEVMNLTASSLPKWYEVKKRFKIERIK